MMQQIFISLQRKSQSYLKTDTRYLLNGGFWTFISYSIQVGIGVITTIALANLLPKDSLGTYQFILALAAIASLFTLSGLGPAITRSVALGNDGVLRSSVRTKLLWSLGIVIVSGGIAAYYFWRGDANFAIAFLIVGACAPFIESFRLYEPYLYGKQAFRDGVLLGAWRKPLPLVALLGAAWFTTNPYLLSSVYFVSNAISMVLVYKVVTNKYQPPLTHDSGTLSFGKHLSLLTTFGKGVAQLDKVVVWHFVGPAAVASYTIAQLATRYSGGFMTSIMSIALPKLSKRDLPTLQKTLPRKVLLFVVAMTALAVLYIVLAPFVFPLLFPEYPESIAMTQLLALGIAFAPGAMFSKALLAHQQLRMQYVSQISLPLAKVVLLLLLAQAYGVWGVIFAILISELLSFVLNFTLFALARIKKSAEPMAEVPTRE